MSEVSDESVLKAWPAHIPSPLDHSYECYDLEEQNAAEKYRRKIGVEPQFNLIYRNLRWLGPNP